MNISAWQIGRFAFVYIFSEPIAFLIQRLFKLSGYQGWQAVIGGFLLSLILLYFTVKLGKIQPDKGWIDFGEDIVGRWPHRLVVLLVMGFALCLVGVEVENFTIFIRSMYMPELPVEMAVFLTLICIALTSRYGLLTIVYMSEGIFFLQMLAIFLMGPIMLGETDKDILISMLTHHDVNRMMVDSIQTLPWFSEWIVFLFLAPLVSFKAPVGRALMIAGGLVVVIIVVFWMLTLMNFGPYVASDLRYPLLEKIRFSKQGGFLGNLDPLLIAIWSTTSFMRSAFLLYVSSVCLTKLTGLPDRRTAVFLLGGTVAGFTLQYARHIAEFEFSLRSQGVAMYVVSMGMLPILYVFLHRIRFGRKSKPASSEPS
ncbi:GerAB/ArcD/ProY family transporter [Paenibacillus puerhi]|uniref:GerAB/ArcD/ProY family transporter n=1 Tax=Paenibacillus puerhi TaxID=2692622 RepID=UPI001F3D244C|nr:GerAB/ArcD/ProY family transporter [Paenibacillus puerhi]